MVTTEYDKFVIERAHFNALINLYLVNHDSIKKQVSVYPFLALGGEAGELQNIIKKIHRDEAGAVSEFKVKELLLELGDILWYLAACAHELGYDLDDVMTANVTKLTARTNVVG